MHTSLDQALGRQPRLNRVGQSLLNIGSGASAAYSLRSLTGGEPKAVRIRRDGDNEERDFTTAEIVNEAADWTNGLQETALPADLGVTSFTTSAFAYGLSSSGVSLAGGASLDDFDGTFTPNSDGTVWSNGSALGVNYAFGAGSWVLNFNDGTNSGSISINATTKYPFEVTNWGSAGVSSGVSGLASAWDQSFTDSYLDFAAAYGETTTYPTAEAAYSLRKVRSTYTGHAVRIRRTSDDAEVNVAFDGNDKVSDSSAITVTSGSSTATTLDGFLNETTSIYTSDFSGADGFSGNQGSIASVDGIGSRDDVLRYTINTSTSSFHMAFKNIGTSSETVRVQGSIYIPSSNSHIDSVAIFIDNGGSSTQVGSTIVPTADQWVDFDVTGQVSGAKIHFRAKDGGTFTITDSAGDDVFYLDNVRVDATQSNAAVHTWYDQSGNSKNATQTTAANQPLIAESGSLHTDGGKPTLKFDGTSHRLELSTKATIANTSIFSAFRSNTITQDSVLFHLAVDASNAVSIGLGDLATRTELGSRLRVGGSNVVEVGDNTFTSTSQSLLGYIASSSAAKMFIDSTEETDTVQSRTSGVNNLIGARGDGNKLFNGDISEVILFDSDQTNNRFKIESNINNHYTIYTAAQNGFVNKWYDQSGNGRNATAAADANEPKIVSAGSYLGELEFDGSNDFLATGQSVITQSNAGSFSYFAVSTIATDEGGYLLGSAGNGSTVGSSIYAQNDSKFSLSSGFNLLRDNITRSSGENLVSACYTGGRANFRFNGGGTSVTAGTFNFNANANFTIANRESGSSAATFLAGSIKEIIAYDADQTANRTAIETNIADEYGITLS